MEKAAAEGSPWLGGLLGTSSAPAAVKVAAETLACVSGQDFNHMFERLSFAFNKIIEQQSSQVP